MEAYGIKRVGGRGYENKNVVRRRKRRSERSFYLFLLLFGASVYGIASAFFRALSASPAWVSVLFSF